MKIEKDEENVTRALDRSRRKCTHHRSVVGLAALIEQRILSLLLQVLS